MSTGEVDVIDETKNNKISYIGGKYSFDELKTIWKCLSEQIVISLQGKKSIIMKDIGQFTLQKWELDAGIQHEIKHFRPVFRLSRSLMEEYDLHQRREYYNDNISVTHFNLCKISEICNCNKEKIIYCIDEVTQCLRRLVADSYNVKLEFPSLGILRIKDTTANFTFYEDIQLKKNQPEDKCSRFENSLKPYFKKKSFPCGAHTSASSQK